MGLFRRVLPFFDRRVDWRVDRRLEERVLPQLPRQEEAIAALSGEFSEVSKQLLLTMGELRRWMTDDLEAAGETAVLLGETLTRLQGSVDRLSAEVERIGGRLEEIAAALPSAGPPGAAGAGPSADAARRAGARPA